MSAPALKDRLRADLKAAMRERKATEVALLRTLIAAIDNAEAVPIAELDAQIRLRVPIGEMARRDLDPSTLDAVLEAEAKSRLVAAEDYERNGRGDDAARLRAEAGLIARYRRLSPKERAGEV